MGPTSTPDGVPTSDMFTEAVTVRVGTGAHSRKFILQDGVPRFYSGYFHAALKRDAFIEGQEHFIDLSTEDTRVFADFVGWLYTRHIPMHEDSRIAFSRIIDLWAFADRRQIPLLANSMINEFRDTLVKDWRIPAGHLPPIYDKTCAEAGLRCLAITLISRTGFAGLALMKDQRKTLAGRGTLGYSMHDLDESAAGAHVQGGDGSNGSLPVPRSRGGRTMRQVLRLCRDEGDRMLSVDDGHRRRR